MLIINRKSDLSPHDFHCKVYKGILILLHRQLVYSQVYKLFLENKRKEKKRYYRYRYRQDVDNKKRRIEVRKIGIEIMF